MICIYKAMSVVLEWQAWCNVMSSNVSRHSRMRDNIGSYGRFVRRLIAARPWRRVRRARGPWNDGGSVLPRSAQRDLRGPQGEFLNHERHERDRYCVVWQIYARRGHFHRLGCGGAGMSCIGGSFANRVMFAIRRQVSSGMTIAVRDSIALGALRRKNVGET